MRKEKEATHAYWAMSSLIHAFLKSICTNLYMNTFPKGICEFTVVLLLGRLLSKAKKTNQSKLIYVFSEAICVEVKMHFQSSFTRK